MKEHWQKAQEWWSKREAREQQALQIGATLITIFIFYAGLWSPMMNSVANLRQQIATDQKTLAFMQAADKQLRLASNEKKNNDRSPIVVLAELQNEIEAAGLTQSLTPLKQTNSDNVELHFQQISFDKMMKFLIQLLKKEPITVTSLSATATDNPGQVNVDLVLKIG